MKKKKVAPKAKKDVKPAKSRKLTQEDLVQITGGCCPKPCWT